MKKIITLSSLLLLVAFIAPSCGVNIVKRQHRGGYYITNNKGYKGAKADNDQENMTAVKEAARPVTVETTAPETAIRTENEAGTAYTETAAVTSTENQSAGNGNELTATSEQNAPAAAAYSSNSTKKSITENKFVNKVIERVPMTKKMKANVKAKQQSAVRGDGLSLFWIVILILLLLYVFGVTGRWFPGGLIHVLLVIALVLLILWLLGIV